MNKMIEKIEATEMVNDVTISAKTVMRTVRERLADLDNDEFVQDIHNDRNNLNGNKRTYRQYKARVETETYVKLRLPRSVRRIIAQFRSGSLPLAIETGRYARPQVPLEDRRCQFCNEGVVEVEKHFLMNCNLNDDLRYELIEKA